MDVRKMLAELHEEQRQIAEAILVLQRIAGGQGKRRGRPPKWLTQVSTEEATTPRKRRPFSRETRAKMAAAQRKRWAAKQKEPS